MLRRGRSAGDRVRRILSRRELADSFDDIERALRKKQKPWGLQGWSIRGRGDRLRVVVKVPYCRVNPRAPVEALAIGPKAFLLKVGVEATFVSARGRATRGVRLGSSHDAPLAPGSPIEVSSGGRSRCGVGAVLELDGDPFLVTCGHTFRGASGQVFLPRGKLVARLTRNLLDGPRPLDAAVCELTPRGLDALAESTHAGTWFGELHRPGTVDNERGASFWPTSEAEPDPIEVRIESFSACFEPLFGPGGPRCRFIEARLPASEGDSGSVLALGGRYYGLCSGTAGTSSYFTALADVADALRRDFRRISPWQPD